VAAGTPRFRNVLWVPLAAGTAEAAAASTEVEVVEAVEEVSAEVAVGVDSEAGATSVIAMVATAVVLLKELHQVRAVSTVAMEETVASAEVVIATTTEAIAAGVTVASVVATTDALAATWSPLAIVEIDGTTGVMTEGTTAATTTVMAEAASVATTMTATTTLGRCLVTERFLHMAGLYGSLSCVFVLFLGLHWGRGRPSDPMAQLTRLEFIDTIPCVSTWTAINIY